MMTSGPGTLQFGWSRALALPLLWCLYFVTYRLPLPPWLVLAAFSAYLGGLLYLYRREQVAVAFATRDVWAALALSVAGLAMHCRSLFYPLGGDELYHAERATLGVKKLQEVADASPLRPHDWLLESPWRLFDVRLFPVIDLWRAVSFAALVGLVLAVLLYRRAGRARPVLELATVALIAALGLWLRLAEENHPPLRLLPWFLSHTALGLSAFSFRLPALLASIAACVFFYRAAIGVRTRALGHAPDAPEQAWIFALALSVQLIPVVLYVSDAVEASPFGYAIWVTVLLLCHLALEDGDRLEPYLIAAGALTGVGAVLRQTTVVLWLAVGAIFVWALWKRRFAHPVTAGLKVFALGPLAAPYFLTVKALGHAAAGGDATPVLEKVWSSLSSGVGPMAIANSTTLPWLAFFGVLLVRLVLIRRASALVLWLLALPAYFLFHSIWSYLWGIGRYQAEYVAPFFVFLLFLTAVHPPRTEGKWALGGGLLVLGLYSLDLAPRLNLDTNYREWPKMRITTTAYLPYDQALEYLKREESHGRFAILGGQPWYGDLSLWLAGYDFTETRQWREAQQRFGSILSAPESAIDTLAARCRQADIGWLLVQRGSRREKQHRTAEIQRAIDRVDRDEQQFKRELTFTDAQGGVIDVVRVRPQP